jgi:transcriptional regulator with XRE-family HTH domain
MTGLCSGRQLRAARILAGYSQRELAIAAGLHPNSVKGWERRSGPISGFAVQQMIDALANRNVRCSQTDFGYSVSVLLV